MSVNFTQGLSTGCKASRLVRNSFTASLLAALFLIYAAALAGWLKPFANEMWAMRAEPVVILAIGYYFGRLPSRRMEEVFGDALARQAQKTDAAQHAKELAQQAGEVLEERIKNAKVILTAARQTRGRQPSTGGESAQAPHGDEALRQSVITALTILDS